MIYRIDSPHFIQDKQGRVYRKRLDCPNCSCPTSPVEFRKDKGSAVVLASKYECQNSTCAWTRNATWCELKETTFHSKEQVKKKKFHDANGHVINAGRA